MKKFLLTIIVFLTACSSALAGNNIELTEGSVASLKEGGMATVVIDMADTKFDNKKPLREDDRYGDVDKDIPEYTREFIREFNDNTKQFRLTDKEEDAGYIFTVKITNLDVYINVMSFKGGVGIKLWGTVTITNKASGETVALFNIDKEGNSGFTYSIALEEGFEGIAKYLAKRIKKGK